MLVGARGRGRGKQLYIWDCERRFFDLARPRHRYLMGTQQVLIQQARRQRRVKSIWIGGAYQGPDLCVRSTAGWVKAAAESLPNDGYSDHNQPIMEGFARVG